MKWNASSFPENRVFDRRLVKDNLVDKWNIYGDTHQHRGQDDYRQFLESYVMFSSVFSSFFWVIVFVLILKCKFIQWLLIIIL